MTIPQQTPYLITQRNFPTDNIEKLGTTLDRAYIDIANRVNERSIGIYNIANPTNTGNKWYIENQGQTTVRQIYPFTNTNSISHDINFQQLDRIVQTYGLFTDGTNWYGLLPASTVAIGGQISYYLSEDEIVFVVDGGAPSLQNGNIVIEWLPAT